MGMRLEASVIVEQLAAEAIRSCADTLHMEYSAGSEEVFALKGGVGVLIAKYSSSSPEAASLRAELHALAGRKRCISVGGSEYELRGSAHESFGETAFRVELRC